jgi:hypothetical protein
MKKIKIPNIKNKKYNSLKFKNYKLFILRIKKSKI